MDNLCASLGIQRSTDGEEPHSSIAVSADGTCSVEFVECLASCHTAPVCMTGDQLHERVNPNSAADLLRNPQSAIGNPKLPWPPHPLEHRLVYKNIGRPGWATDIDCYLRDGGYEQLKQALTLSRDDIVNKVKNSGLRGRGGAGFSCGLKWSFIKPDEKRPVYLICNAGHIQRPLHHPRGPAPVARRNVDLVLCAWRAHRVHLHPRRIPGRR